MCEWPDLEGFRHSLRTDRRHVLAMRHSMAVREPILNFAPEIGQHQQYDDHDPFVLFEDVCFPRACLQAVMPSQSVALAWLLPVLLSDRFASGEPLPQSKPSHRANSWLTTPLIGSCSVAEWTKHPPCKCLLELHHHKLTSRGTAVRFGIVDG